MPSLLALATTPCPIRHWTGSLLLQQLCLRLALWLVITGPCSSIVLHLPRWGVIHCSCSTVVFDSPSGVSPSLLQGMCVRLDTKIGLTRRPEIRHPFLGGGFGLGVCAGLRVFSMVRVCLFGWLFFSFVLFACLSENVWFSLRKHIPADLESSLPWAHDLHIPGKTPKAALTSCAPCRSAMCVCAPCRQPS